MTHTTLPHPAGLESCDLEPRRTPRHHEGRSIATRAWGAKRTAKLTMITIAGLTTREKLERARAAASNVAELSTADKEHLLLALATAIEAESESILAANRRDLESSGLEAATRDRLLLTPERVATIARNVREIAALPDPIGDVLAEWTRPNGLQIRKVRVPLGVVGIIYESRPNVTIDTVTLALKSGNAIVLRGGKEAANSNQRLVQVVQGTPGMPEGAIQLLDSSSRDSVHELIKARGLVDVIIPRGGAELINFVVQNSAVPVIETGAGNCHIFVDESAELEMADRIVLNAKTSRPSVCNAAEKLLVHRGIARAYVPRIVRKFVEHGVEVRGDAEAVTLAGTLGVRPANADDWSEEYLRLCIAVRVVGDVEEAIAHINQYSTQNTEAIVTQNEAHAKRFLRAVDSATVFWNASTRFSDGGEFGFGAEMGISTQKLHCRGPFALKELTSTKYEVIGTGQIR